MEVTQSEHKQIFNLIKAHEGSKDSRFTNH